jgi:hypothetical protein
VPATQAGHGLGKRGASASSAGPTGLHLSDIDRLMGSWTVMRQAAGRRHQHNHG